jgi:hypothetical protein
VLTRFRQTLATGTLEMGGMIQEAAHVPGDSGGIIRKHYAEWSIAPDRREFRTFWHVYGTRKTGIANSLK